MWPGSLSWVWSIIDTHIPRPVDLTIIGDPSQSRPPTKSTIDHSMDESHGEQRIKNINVFK